MSEIPAPVIVMTGATSGIGRLAAIELAKRGAHLVLIARSETNAETTRNAIRTIAPRAQIDIHFADLTRLETVSAVGRAIAARYDRIDVLINNAGIHAFAPRSTVDGHDEMMAVNYLSPWLLTNVLRETLVRSAPSRIVTTASEASRRHGKIKLTRDMFAPTGFSGLGSSRIYGRTKLLDIMFSLELARQLEGTGVAVNCLDPGFNVTGLGRELSFAPMLERVLMRLKIGDPRRGADIIVRLAMDAEFGIATGGYFSVKGARPLKPVPPGDDPDARRALWGITRDALGVIS
ncbi:SDR family NAD(P)-dependent oxidoreductase [Rhizobium calliandrae]|uniref:SDR family NAD(P)-dependent oxidoreductase n=1 Tax=Rhizobium calliandrae TaxID=1312182 RepID=A0ABT7KM70_9HYPH|nr:SDR family NAD(P)-dependent oxidoreductase [Rhizobium calliandrae]MDL2409739.1 SDR family NAD(P)-dependent oxidoreductase [Rhizobium calliandrae]